MDIVVGNVDLVARILIHLPPLDAMRASRTSRVWREAGLYAAKHIRPLRSVPDHCTLTRLNYRHVSAMHAAGVRAYTLVAFKIPVATWYLDALAEVCALPIRGLELGVWQSSYCDAWNRKHDACIATVFDCAPRFKSTLESLRLLTCSGSSVKAYLEDVPNLRVLESTACVAGLPKRIQKLVLPAACDVRALMPRMAHVAVLHASVPPDLLETVLGLSRLRDVQLVVLGLYGGVLDLAPTLRRVHLTSMHPFSAVMRGSRAISEISLCLTYATVAIEGVSAIGLASVLGYVSMSRRVRVDFGGAAIAVLNICSWDAEDMTGARPAKLVVHHFEHRGSMNLDSSMVLMPGTVVSVLSRARLLDDGFASECVERVKLVLERERVSSFDETERVYRVLQTM